MKVRTILATTGNFSHVVVDRETFDKVNGYLPELPYTTSVDALGRGVRIYNVDGINLYSRKDKESGKTIFILNSKDAAKLLEDREDALEFSF
jgi:hypothetical protein